MYATLSKLVHATIPNPAIRFGIKLGLAGVLAIYLALLLRLHQPTWALFTVFVLMISPYVGSMREKIALRILGTIVGVTLGYLVLNLVNEPLLFLVAVGLITAFCVSMLGQHLWAYGFFLCGLTLIDVVQPSLHEPERAWHHSISRMEEVSIGIIAVLLVQSLIWPRYAARELQQQIDASLSELREGFQEIAKTDLSAGCEKVLDKMRKFSVRSAKIRSILVFGSIESRYFRIWGPVFYEIANSIERISLGVAALSKPLELRLPMGADLNGSLRSILHACNGAISALEDKNLAEAGRRAAQDRLNSSFAGLEQFLSVRTKEAFQKESPSGILSLGRFVLGAFELRRELLRLHELFAVVSSGKANHVFQGRSPGFSIPKPFWFRLGIKGGIAVAVALLLEDWINPPGGEILAISTWILVVRGPTAPAGRGDWRAFHSAIISVVAWLLFAVIMLLIHPVLSSYGVMNVLLFSALFIWGYLSFGKSPMTTPMLVGMLMIVSVLGLNGQRPISFQDIADITLGMCIAVILSALIRRLIWPTLPQCEIHDRLVELNRISQHWLEGKASPSPESLRTRLAQIPTEAALRLKLLARPILTTGEGHLIDQYLQLSFEASIILSASVGGTRDGLIKKIGDQNFGQIERMEKQLHEYLIADKNQLTANQSVANGLSKIRAEMSQWEKWMTDLCHTDHAGLPTSEWLQLLGFLKRFDEAASKFTQAGTISSQIKWSDFRQDVSL